MTTAWTLRIHPFEAEPFAPSHNISRETYRKICTAARQHALNFDAELEPRRNCQRPALCCLWVIVCAMALAAGAGLVFWRAALTLGLATGAAACCMAACALNTALVLMDRRRRKQAQQAFARDLEANFVTSSTGAPIRATPQGMDCDRLVILG